MKAAARKFRFTPGWWATEGSQVPQKLHAPSGLPKSRSVWVGGWRKAPSLATFVNKGAYLGEGYRGMDPRDVNHIPPAAKELGTTQTANEA